MGSANRAWIARGGKVVRAKINDSHLALTKLPLDDSGQLESVDRFARDLAELLRITRKLRRANVELVGVSDGIASNQKGAKIALTLRGLIAEVYLDDLAEKTHRGLDARARAGLNAGGGCFGYRSEAVSGGARLVIDEDEAAVVRRIWRDFGNGLAPTTIARNLNVEGVPFPSAATRRGPVRRGWSASTVRFLLKNERYVGRVVWNKRKFESDDVEQADGTLKKVRRPVLRPEREWVVTLVPEQRIIDEVTAERVRTRFESITGYGSDIRRRAALSKVSYSRHAYLLTGLLRCVCGAKMTASTLKRVKPNGRVYEYASYWCPDAERKGPTVCRHTTRYPREVLEGALLDRIERVTGSRLENLVARVNKALAHLTSRDPGREKRAAAELEKRRAEGARVARAIAEGASFDSLRGELTRIDAQARALEAELREAAVQKSPAVVHPDVVRREIEEIQALLTSDVARAKMKIARHLRGDVTITPEPSEMGEHRARITGIATARGLLAPRSDTGGRVVASGDCGGRI